ncbi:NADH:flavin oxidoreductase/NADH oxidase [Holophaga foetida]|uniref:NADH:flavin oxidoreductase/NADH oxidase n=1 Tax=Holophaga foetida TaxID=35839 RepID=UPI0002474304|nr:NADH:flavin oxidoreductase/NADH oxidase [Holophaga foetida]
MDPLFTPFALGCLTLPNRIVIPPMCQYSATDGRAGDWHRMHWGSLGVSGAGLLIVEATAVLPEGRISPQDIGLWSEDTEDAMRDVLDSIRSFSRVPLGIQLAHAGRKASCRSPWMGGGQANAVEGGWRPVAPSALPFAEEDCEPSVLDAQGIRRVVEAFAQSALRARRLGFQAIELHAAHGYLLHQFLSPLSNHRSDAYGGSLENRMRLTLEVFEAMRELLPDRALGVRISATDWVEGGWDLEQSVVLAKALKARGCDYIHVSGGGLSPLQKIPLGPGYQVSLAARIKAEAGLPTIAVGLVTEPQQAAAIVATGEADLVAVGRAMLYDPRWPWHAAAALGEQVDAPPQYWRSQPHGLKNLFKIP